MTNSQWITTEISADKGEKFAPDAFNRIVGTKLDFGMLWKVEVAKDGRNAELTVEVTDEKILSLLKLDYGLVLSLENNTITPKVCPPARPTFSELIDRTGADRYLRLRESDQPLPVPNDNPAVHDLVADDLIRRKELGIQRYGVALQPDNLRDAYEECLDLAVYLRTEMEERRMAEATMEGRRLQFVNLLGLDSDTSWGQIIIRIRELRALSRLAARAGLRLEEGE